ncbi:MAG: capsular biosynthesis protein [Anaerococcus hydrogenalis]|uniref:YveK family protein n=1 Tax=Anaerococcus hydrogenalis TaxID=33029 RepID=UPI00290FA589|nr:capsular biosynthesis protein [Anaerococcus hydrogenalis]MDU3688313.1 capsular biosynthesis protein [Anaerococcus hydrogenalis]
MKKKESIFVVIQKSLIFGLILGIGFYFLSDRFGFKKYKAQAKILTTSNEKIKDQDKTTFTYAETVNSNAIKKRVIENLKLDINEADLDKKVQIQAIPNTHILNINVEDSVKLRAEDIADEYAEITVSVINELYKADSFIIDHAYPNATLVKTTNKDVLKMGLAGFLTYFIFGSLLLFIRNFKIDEDEDNTDQRLVRKVVFEEDGTDNYEYEEDSYEDVINEENFEDSYVKEYDVDEQVEDNNYDNEEIQEEKIDYDQSFKYVDSANEDEEDFEIYENKENNKEYTIIADIPKYDDGDLDV